MKNIVQNISLVGSSVRIKEKHIHYFCLFSAQISVYTINYFPKF